MFSAGPGQVSLSTVHKFRKFSETVDDNYFCTLVDILICSFNKSSFILTKW